eukprot:s2706_g13.t1
MLSRGSGNSDGPLVQPFLFVDFVEVARRSATGEALACLEDLWDLPLPESGGNCIKSEHDQRKILARWIRQANVSKSLAESRTAWSASEPEADDVQSLAVASCTFSLWSEQIDAVATASGDEADTVHAVFSTLARQRVSLLRAVEAIDAQERDKSGRNASLDLEISRTHSDSLQTRGGDQSPNQQGCLLASPAKNPSPPLQIPRVTPCKDDLGKNAVKVVRLPKASRIIVRFDPLSQLDTGDFLKIYTKGIKGTKGKEQREMLWSGGRSEIARRGWPGVDAPGLVIEGEAFTIEMSRIMKLGEGEEVAYGYRLIAEAELAPSTVCASILSECGGDVQEALRLLPEVRQKWEELESLSEKRQQSLGLRSGGCFVATQATALEDPDKA